MWVCFVCMGGERGWVCGWEVVRVCVVGVSVRWGGGVVVGVRVGVRGRVWVGGGRRVRVRWGEVRVRVRIRIRIRVRVRVRGGGGRGGVWWDGGAGCQGGADRV